MTTLFLLVQAAFMASRPNPEGWKGGGEDFTFLSATHGRLSEDHYGTEDGYKDRRNDKSHFDWGDCD